MPLFEKVAGGAWRSVEALSSLRIDIPRPLKFEGKKRDLILLIPCTLIVADPIMSLKRNPARKGEFLSCESAFFA